MQILILLINCLLANALVWPKPKYMEQYKLSNYQVIDPTNFEIILQGNSAKCDILIEAVKRYKKKLFADDCSLFDHKRNHHKTIYPNNSADDSYEGNLTRLVINNLDNCPKYPSEDMLESYHLKTNTVGEASLRAEQVWGILTGLETFSQLVFWNGQFFGVNMTLIKDSPRFNLRGIMLDTSRHFLPVHILQQNLDAMEGNKMNVFHWHIVDDQSFPYVSTKFPQMSKKGAFSDKHVYSQEDIKSIIDYARLRGIRVIVEFDTPGHSLSWGKGIKDLLTPCYDSRRQLNGQFGPIDPSVKKNYKFMGDLLKEIGQVFPDNYLHLGGDEVDFSCWKSNPNITQFMKRYKLPDYESLEGFFIKLIAKYAAKMGKTNIFWQEVFENKVQVDLKNSIIHVWKDWGNYKLAMDNITKAGYKVILSSPWYLNYISYGTDWTKYYQIEPLDFTKNVDQQKLVIGGAACMWAEFVDATNVIPRTWARASAVAERLWSTQTTRDLEDAKMRIDQHRCRMLNRGIRAEPIVGPGHCRCDYLI